jgi:hypothetical protein
MIKEVSVTLGSLKAKCKGPRERSMPEALNRFNPTATNHNNSGRKKRNKVESRLFQPTAASKHKTEAILMERQKRFEKKQKEIKKM